LRHNFIDAILDSIEGPFNSLGAQLFHTKEHKT
jgi:hypothetical protein